MSGLLDDLPVKEEKKPQKERKAELGIALDCDDKKRIVTAGMKSVYTIKMKNTGGKTETFIIKTDIIHGKTEDSPEWPVALKVSPGPTDKKPAKSRKAPAPKQIEGESKPKEVRATLAGGEERDIELVVDSPRGAKYGDRADVIVTAIAETDPAVSATVNTTTTAKQAVLALKTAIGHERNVAEALQQKAVTKDSGIFAILSPNNVRGYVFVESMNVDRLRDIARGIPKAHGLVEGETSFKEIEHFLTPKPVVAGISEGAIVELIAGPFKGERAMVKSIDDSKEEITVELIEAMVAIPVTVRGDHVRVLQRD